MAPLETNTTTSLVSAAMFGAVAMIVTGMHRRRQATSSETTTTTTSKKNPTHDFEHSWEPEIADKIHAALKERKNASGKPTIRERSMDDQQQQQQHQTPYMIALVGIPGGGKSVSSLLLAHFLEELNPNAGVMIMPHDGYHIPLKDLQKLPNAKDAIYRRGAPDTFDPAALKRDLRRIRYGSSAAPTIPDSDDPLIRVPGFDHSQGDPTPDQHVFDRNHHQVVICEGLYLLHDGDGWEEIADLFDLKLFIDSDVDACVERLKIRNLCIPGYTPEEIQIRCEQVDRVNAMTVMKSQKRADQIVSSIVSTNKEV